MSSAPQAAVLARLPLVADLARHGDRVALLDGDRSLTYADLAARVGATAARLGGGRRLVLVEGAHRTDVVVAYLAALHAGHVVLLVPGGTPADALTAAYDPDVVVRAGAAGAVVEERRDGSAHDLHPDLALLLSTSGSTGSPKLVRLSAENLQANAEAIAEYLDIRPTDRAATTLPMEYCYGLSVLHSHLLRGAGVVLTDLSVVDTCFWDLVREQRVSTFAGVPFTFDLLDRVGFDAMNLPHLRYVTQAGGRLDPERVRRYARLGRRRGWDLVVMYGQTEATARMAYLPPDLAAEHPHTVGVPVPGGSVRLGPVPESDEPGVGELVYSGPNVMLGYAETPADLALGRTVHELRTGDLARRTEAGLLEVVGRRSRFAKVVGLRIDLGEVERRLAATGLASCAVDDGHRVLVAVEGDDVHPSLLGRWLAGELGVPPSAVVVVPVPEIPRLPNGKPDQSAVRTLGAGDPEHVEHGGAPGDLRELYAVVLDRPDATEDSTFVSLGGDSLSYVEMSVHLEERLGHLPPAWHTTPIRDLSPREPVARRRPWSGRRIETSVALRAVAILLVVGTHGNLITVPGGAHLLLAVAGFNLGRFPLAEPDRVRRTRGLLASMGRVVVPSVAWIGAMVVLGDLYRPETALLLTNVLGPDRWGPAWHFWFLEAVVYLVLALTAVLAVPALHRLERRSPFGVALGAVGVGLLFRFGVLDLDSGPHIQTPQNVLWLFGLGWAAAQARTVPQRLVVSAAALVAVPGFFGDPVREAIVAVTVLLLLWVPDLPCPPAATRVAGVLAGSSLYVYVTHWDVYPHLEDDYPLLAVLASFAVGIAYWKVAGAGMRAGSRLWRRTAGGTASADGDPEVRREGGGEAQELLLADARPGQAGRAGQGVEVRTTQVGLGQASAGEVQTADARVGHRESAHLR